MTFPYPTHPHADAHPLLPLSIQRPLPIPPTRPNAPTNALIIRPQIAAHALRSPEHGPALALLPRPFPLAVNPIFPTTAPTAIPKPIQPPTPPRPLKVPPIDRIIAPAPPAHALGEALAHHGAEHNIRHAPRALAALQHRELVQVRHQPPVRAGRRTGRALPGEDRAALVGARDDDAGEGGRDAGEVAGRVERAAEGVFD
ncbi:MAG: hypothetical protein LQ340_007503 [Diploschistes diacapsis]|nr:MAG: hypothetical protein LQ340_007503 [Diploschistes diacapsis]